MKTAPSRTLPFLSAIAVAQLCLATPAAAQPLPPPQDPSQFDMVGWIQEATLDPACLSTDDKLCPGTITVNNQRIIVPRNTILQMPARAITWQETFALAPAPYGLELFTKTGVAMSGLAMSDLPAPEVPYEARIVGNRVGDDYIAGLIFLSQRSLQSGQGFINYIDYATGALEVGGEIGVQGTGQLVLVNDPIGSFGRATAGALDERFSIDEGNPTIRSETGYPMCIPRQPPNRGSPANDDRLCPQANRPLDAASPSGFMMIFTMPAVNLANPPVPGLADPRLMAPFEIGDFVTYSGVLLDGSSPAASRIAAFQVIGNVGIFTAPGTDPAYVATDVTILGVGGVTVAGLTEATARTRFEGFSTDIGRTIQLYAVDVDPCTGATVAPLRDWGSVTVDPGPPTGAVAGRWRFRPPNKVATLPSAGTFLPATREVRVVIAGAAAVPVSNAAITAGLYQAPIYEFLFPENAGVGTPIVPNNFQDMPFLADGSGQLFLGGPIVGTLSPWPGAPAPVARVCADPTTPTANAGPDQLVASASLVQLDGSASTDGGFGPLSYAWTQTSGPGVALSSATATRPTFVAPTTFVTSATLTFQLVVTNAANPPRSSAVDTVDVVVNPVVSDRVTISLVEYRQGKSRLIVNAASDALPAGVAVLTVQSFDAKSLPLGPAQPMTFSGGIYLIDLVGVPQPDHVVVQSDHGGSAISGITRLR